MAIVSISEAARLTGKSRKTIQRYVADGRLSLSQLDAGNKGLDISELVRVFGQLSHPSPPPPHETVSQRVPSTVAMDVQARLVAVEAENAVLRAQLEAKDAQIEAKDANLADLRQSLRLLEYSPASKRRWWWAKNKQN